MKLSNSQPLSKDMFQQIVYDSNQTDKAFPKDKAIHQLFEEQVVKTPDNIALIFEGDKLTYQELNEQSNQLARYIRDKYKSISSNELQSDTLIALYLDRGLEMIISILAVFKAGAAYVPISPEFPQERIDYILKDTQTQILISQTHLTDKLESNIGIIYADQKYLDCLATDLRIQIDSRSLAYIIYTSGTTGNPKGVMIEHHSLTSFITLFKHKITYSKLTHIHMLSLTNYVFDIFGLEYALPLIHGGYIVLSSISNINEIELKQVNIIQQTPNVLVEICEKYGKCLIDKVALVGGEKGSSKIINKLLTSFKDTYNVYGPAETVIWSSIHLFTAASEYSCIGKALYNEKLYILDKNLKPSPLGIVGELYIGGNGLARGYLNLPELTQEKFVNNPFITKEDKQQGYIRMYKTGDLCKWLNNGEIEYIGRSDFQVKLRGFRIELGEIENAISSVDGIKQSCVLVKNELLIAYYVSDKEVNETTIKNRLANKLPNYMLPHFYMKLEFFPLTINGKLDRKALPERNSLSRKYVAPQNLTQIRICKIWQELLKIDNINIDDDFFDLGGNSLLAINASYEMSKTLNKSVNVADIFSSRTISNLIDNLSTDFKLIKQLNPIIKSNQETIYFIHPAFSGCEVYAQLADKLSKNYNCIGVDNYNLYEEEKINSLSQLSKLYIEKLQLRLKDKNDPIILSGWSLGGLIAFEMAVFLEQYGFSNIQVILFDPHIPIKKTAKYHAHFNPDKGGRRVEDYIQELVKGLDDKYIQRVTENKDIDIAIANTKPSAKLRHTKVFLFKALKQPGYFIKDNNLSRYTKNLNIVKIDVDHVELISTILKEWDKYHYTFLTRRFDLLEIQQDKFIYAIFSLKKIALYYKKLILSVVSSITAFGLYILDTLSFIIDPLTYLFII